MQKLTRMVTAAIFVAAWPMDTASAKTSDDTSCKLTLELLKFVASETGYSEPTECPRIVLATSEALLSFVSFSSDRHRRMPIAVYMPVDGIIFVSDELQLGSPIGQSFLVHELVHALQFETGASAQFPCLGALEAEAYRTQSAFLEREGFPQQALEFRSYELVMASCAHAYHPEF